MSGFAYIWVFLITEYGYLKCVCVSIYYDVFIFIWDAVNEPYVIMDLKFEGLLNPPPSNYSIKKKLLLEIWSLLGLKQNEEIMSEHESLIRYQGMQLSFKNT